MRDAIEAIWVGSVLTALLAAGCATDRAGDDDVQKWNDAMNLYGAGAETVTPSDYGEGATPANPPPPFTTHATVTCQPIVNGTNSVIVNGRLPLS